MSNTPGWGKGLLSIPPLQLYIYPQLGVVGQYIDRCIRIAGFFYGAHCHWKIPMCSQVNLHGSHLAIHQKL